MDIQSIVSDIQSIVSDLHAAAAKIRPSLPGFEEELPYETFKPIDAYVAAESKDAKGNYHYYTDEASLANPNARIIIKVAFFLDSKRIEGEFDPNTDQFSDGNGWWIDGNVHAAAMETIEHFHEKLLSGPLDPLVGHFNSLTIPLVKKIYPALYADKLVSVQPLAQPTSLVFYMKHTYSKSKMADKRKWIPRR